MDAVQRTSSISITSFFVLDSFECISVVQNLLQIAQILRSLLNTRMTE